MFIVQLIHQRRRAISPAIASILLIALTLAAGAVVVGVLNSIEQRSNLVDTSDTNIGVDGTSGLINPPTINITKLTKDTFLQLQGVDDFVQITIKVTNFNQIPIYVFDVDIILYGEKLDEIAQWEIDPSEVTGDAEYTSKNGEFEGYKQNFGSTANYIVRLNDVNNTQARIPDGTNFVYEVFYGDEPGLITNSVQKMKISEIIFNTVYYKVAIFHGGSSFLFDDAAGQYEDTMTGLNGTNKLFFLYDRAQDAYDYVNNAAGINTTYIKLNYDLVIVDVWAVPTAIADKLWQIHVNGTKLIFYGSLNDLGNNLNEIKNNIDYNKTELITGLIPNPYDPNIYPEGGGGQRETNNGYQFSTGITPLLAGLSGRSFVESTELNFIIKTGDSTGYDAANLTMNAQLNISTYGSSYYDFKRGSNPSYWTHNGPLITQKKQIVNGSGNTFAFTWKHNEDLADFSTATITNPAHLTSIRRNMLTASFLEVERTTAVTADIDILTLDIVEISNNNRQFAVEFTAEVIDGYIIGQSLEFNLDMPDSFNFVSNIFNLNIYVDIDNDGTFDIQNIPLEVGAGNVMVIDVGAYYNDTIPLGNVIKVRIPESGSRLFKFDQDTSPYDWTLTAYYNVIRQTTKIFTRAVDSSLDTIPPAQVTGLTATTVSGTSIDLSWTANVEPDMSYYTIYRGGTEIATVSHPTISFTDSGLSGSTNYSYTVSATDNAAIPNEGAQSDPAWAVTFETIPPAQVTGLTANAQSSSQIDLSWDANLEPDLDRYNIYRNGTQIAQITITTYSDTGLLSDTNYEYRVSAVDTSSNEGIQSNAVIEKTNINMDPPPAQVQNLVAVAVSPSQIDLTWNANTEPDIAYYIIYKDGLQIGTTTSISYSAIGLTEGTQYNFEVSAVDTPGGEGPKSSVATTTTYGKMHIQNVVLVSLGRTAGGSNWRQDFDVTVTMYDSFGNPIQGVNVEVTITPNSGGSKTSSGVTDVNGVVTIRIIDVGNIFANFFTADVTNVTDLATMIYDPSANVVTSDSVSI